MFSEQFTPSEIDCAIQTAAELWNSGKDNLSRRQIEVLQALSEAMRRRGDGPIAPPPLVTTIIQSVPSEAVTTVIDPERNLNIPLGEPHGHEPFDRPVYRELSRSGADELRGAFPHLTTITLAAPVAAPSPGASLYDCPGIHLHLLRAAYQQVVLVRTDVTAPAFPHCCALVLPSLASGLAHLAAAAESID